jgi:tRNA threonylcarbamoyladenosine modification (KEOPS) complex  Pcc1 subunit
LNKGSDLAAISATIEIVTEPRAQLVVLEVLKPELAQQVSSRSSVEMESFDHGLRIRVRGTDLSSFRASINSIIRLLNLVFEVLRTVSNSKDDEQGG